MTDVQGLSRPVAVVAGATSGIGRALALRLARGGDRVVGLGRNPERLASLAQDLGQGHDVLGLDVASPQDMDRLADHLQGLGRVDLLICSAVMGRVRQDSALPAPTRDLSLADFNATMDVNLHGVFLANQAVLPLMRAAGDGDIVNISSAITPHGQKGQPLALAYSATKFALVGYGRTLAEELAPEGIRVRTVLPGPVDTPLIARTALGVSFSGAMTAEHFADALLGLVKLGRVVAVPDPHVVPMPLRAV